MDKDMVIYQGAYQTDRAHYACNILVKKNAKYAEVVKLMEKYILSNGHKPDEVDITQIVKVTTPLVAGV